MVLLGKTYTQIMATFRYLALYIPEVTITYMRTTTVLNAWNSNVNFLRNGKPNETVSVNQKNWRKMLFGEHVNVSPLNIINYRETRGTQFSHMTMSCSGAISLQDHRRLCLTPAELWEALSGEQELPCRISSSHEIEATSFPI